jgi:hypothetical protein
MEIHKHEAGRHPVDATVSAGLGHQSELAAQASGDICEKEANRVSEQVMRMR